MNARPVYHAALALIACVTSLFSMQPAAAQTTPSFEPAECAIILKPAIDNPVLTRLLPDDNSIDCGYVSVPEEHSKDNGKSIKLAVAVLRATDTDGKRLNETVKLGDPLIMLQGGPGGSTIDTYNFAMRNSKLRRERDIVNLLAEGATYRIDQLICSRVNVTVPDFRFVQQHEVGFVQDRRAAIAPAIQRGHQHHMRRRNFHWRGLGGTEGIELST